MSILLLDHTLPLHSSQRGSAIRSIAQARTLSTLRNMDPERQVTIVRFLFLSRLLDVEEPIIRLDGLVMTGCDFSGLNLSYANLMGISFQKSVFEQTLFSGANLTGASFRNAKMTQVVLDKATLVGAIFEKAVLIKSDLSYADGTGSNLKASNLKRAKLQSSNLTNTNLSRTNLSFADLQDAKLVNADLSKSVLLKTKVKNAYMFKVNLRWSLIVGTNLSNAQIVDLQYSLPRRLLVALFIKVKKRVVGTKVGIYDEQTGEVLEKRIR